MFFRLSKIMLNSVNCYMMVFDSTILNEESYCFRIFLWAIWSYTKTPILPTQLPRVSLSWHFSKLCLEAHDNGSPCFVHHLGLLCLWHGDRQWNLTLKACAHFYCIKTVSILTFHNPKLLLLLISRFKLMIPLNQFTSVPPRWVPIVMNSDLKSHQ